MILNQDFFIWGWVLSGMCLLLKEYDSEGYKHRFLFIFCSTKSSNSLMAVLPSALDDMS